MRLAKQEVEPGFFLYVMIFTSLGERINIKKSLSYDSCILTISHKVNSLKILEQIRK